MVEHICQKCNKTFNHKGAYDRHLNRQKSCIIIQKNPILELKIPTVDPDKKILHDQLKCNHCLNDFSTKSNLSKHLNGRCKIMKNNEMYEIKNELSKIKQLLEETKNKTTNISNNNTNNNTNNGVIQNNTNNITINQYGKEDLSHLTFNDFNGIFNKCNSCVPNLIDLIHFNKDKPENNNIYISNMKGPYAMIYDGHKWNVADKNTTVDDMYDDKCDILVSKYENLKDHLDEKTMTKFTKFLNKYEDEDIKKNITKNIKLMLYNNREIVSK